MSSALFKSTNVSMSCQHSYHVSILILWTVRSISSVGVHTSTWHSERGVNLPTSESLQSVSTVCFHHQSSIAYTVSVSAVISSPVIYTVSVMTSSPSVHTVSVITSLALAYTVHSVSFDMMTASVHDVGYGIIGISVQCQLWHHYH